MTVLFPDELLRRSARQMSCQLASALPKPEAAAPPAFDASMAALARRACRRQSARTLGRRVAAIALAAALTFGAVLAVSPAAWAAARQWFLEFTNLAVIYHIDPVEGDTAAKTGIPAAPPSGYTLSTDLTGQDGIRVLRYTSPRGDLLFESIPITGGVRVTAELRSDETGGLYDNRTGLRPTGETGTPEGYAVTETTVHGIGAQLYRFTAAGEATHRSYGLWFYRENERESFHFVALHPSASALVWIDEQASCLFLLTGGASQQELLSMAESVYQS